MCIACGCHTMHYTNHKSPFHFRNVRNTTPYFFHAPVAGFLFCVQLVFEMAVHSGRLNPSSWLSDLMYLLLLTTDIAFVLPIIGLIVAILIGYAAFVWYETFPAAASLYTATKEPLQASLVFSGLRNTKLTKTQIKHVMEAQCSKAAIWHK